MTNRNIVHKVTRQYMSKNKKRTLTTMLGIMLMVMLMTCVFVGKDTAVNYLEELASQEKGRWHMSVYDITRKEYDAITKLDFVEETAISADLGYAEFSASANIERPFIFIKSYQENGFDMMNIHAVEGRLPEKESEIVISTAALEDGAEIKIGDTLSAACFERYLEKDEANGTITQFPAFGIVLNPGEKIEVPQNFPYFGSNEDFAEVHESTGFEQTYTVVGFIEPPFFERNSAASYIALTATETELPADAPFNLSVIFDLKNGGFYDGEFSAKLTAVTTAVSGESRLTEANSLLLAFSANSPDSTINLMVKLMTVFFVALIIAASVVLIYNVFNMSFEERSKYLGMLSSIGATGKQKRSSVYYEAFSLLVAALPAGFVLGLLVIKLGMVALKPHLDFLVGSYSGAGLDRVSLEISLAGVVLTAVFSALTVWISAYIPAHKISKTGAIESIRGNTSRKSKGSPINEKLIDKLGAEGMVAGASILRDSKKNRGIIGAAAVFMVVLIVTSFSSNLITMMVEKAMLGGESVYTTVDYDFGIVSDIGGQHEAQYEAIKAEALADENVENIIEYYNGFHLARAEAGVYGSEYWNAVDKIMDAYGLTEEQKTEYGRTPTDEAIFLMAFDDATFARIVNATDADASITGDEAARAAIIIQDGALTTDNYIYPGDADFKFFEIEHMTDKQVGETFETYVYSPSEMDYKTFPLTVAGLATKEQLSEIFIEDSVRMCVIISRSTMEELAAVTLEENGAECEKNLLMKFRNTDCTLYSDLAQRTYDTENEYTPESIEVFRNVGVQAKSISDAITSAIRVLLVCFVVLTSLICMLNLFNSVRGKIAGRKMEFAALRSVGMTDHQFVKMLTLECCGIFAASAIAAIVVATPLIYLVRTVLVDLFGNLSTSIPFGMYLLAIALTAAALFLFTFFSFRAEKNKNILEDIRRESI